jgi:choline dehydrogenase-like flavoprotein
MEVMAAYKRLATFGLMVQDTARGTVREGPNGSPLMTYDMNAHDLARMQKGVAKVCAIMLAAGAKRALPFVVGTPEVRNATELRALGERKLRPGDIEVTAYHPLGTARVGVDPRTSVLRPDHETHEVERLYVTDGSAVPSSLGVNPQMTIMAMALRAAEGIDARLGR